MQTTDTSSSRKPGRPKLDDSKKLTAAQRQKRWRDGKASKQVDTNAGTKIQVSITLDQETLDRLDACAAEILDCKRSEAIRLLLNARISQLESVSPAIRAMETGLSTGPFAKYVPTIKTRHLGMLRSGRCPHEIALLCRKDLQQFHDSIAQSLQAFEQRESLPSAERLIDEIGLMQGLFDEQI